MSEVERAEQNVENARKGLRQAEKSLRQAKREAKAEAERLARMQENDAFQAEVKKAGKAARNCAKQLSGVEYAMKQAAYGFATEKDSGDADVGARPTAPSPQYVELERRRAELKAQLAELLDGVA